MVRAAGERNAHRAPVIGVSHNTLLRRVDINDAVCDPRAASGICIGRIANLVKRGHEKGEGGAETIPAVGHPKHKRVYKRRT